VTPRLLVATEFPPNAAGGGPAVVRQMLKEWPVGSLHWWSCFPDADRRFGQDVASHHVAQLPAKLRPLKRATRIKAAVLEWFWTPWAAAHLRKTIAAVEPEAIWVIPHNWSVPPIASALPGSKEPFHVTMQDYIDVHQHPEKFGDARCRRMVEQAERLYANATTRDATSHPMIADLKARTGKDAAQMLHAGLEPEDFDFLQQKSTRDLSFASTMKIAHAGTILVEDVFEKFVTAVREIRNEVPRRIELHLFGAHSYAQRRWFDPEWMVEHGNLAEPELLQKLRDCDFGFSPMALHDDDPRYNRFSFPTKFITYLAAGLPIITLGHPESSVMKMVQRYEVGPIQSANDPAALAAQLRAAFSEPDLWERYRAEIIRCAESEFDAAKMRAVLYACFAKSAAGRQ